MIVGQFCPVLIAYWFVYTISLYQFWSKPLLLNSLSLFYVGLYRLLWCGMLLNVNKPHLYNTVALKAIQGRLCFHSPDTMLLCFLLQTTQITVPVIKNLRKSHRVLPSLTDVFTSLETTLNSSSTLVLQTDITDSWQRSSNPIIGQTENVRTYVLAELMDW